MPSGDQSGRGRQFDTLEREIKRGPLRQIDGGGASQLPLSGAQLQIGQLQPKRGGGQACGQRSAQGHVAHQPSRQGSLLRAEPEPSLGSGPGCHPATELQRRRGVAWPCLDPQRQVDGCVDCGRRPRSRSVAEARPRRRRSRRAESPARRRAGRPGPPHRRRLAGSPPRLRRGAGIRRRCRSGARPPRARRTVPEGARGPKAATARPAPAVGAPAATRSARCGRQVAARARARHQSGPQRSGSGGNLDPVADHGTLNDKARPGQQLEPHRTGDPNLGATRLAHDPGQLAAQGRHVDQARPRDQERHGQRDQDAYQNQKAAHASQIRPPLELGGPARGATRRP